MRHKVLAVIGAALMTGGTEGMVFIGLQLDRIIENKQLDNQAGNGFWLQMTDYAFMFTMIGGLVLVLHSLVSLQSIRAKQNEPKMYGHPRYDTSAQAA